MLCGDRVREQGVFIGSQIIAMHMGCREPMGFEVDWPPIPLLLSHPQQDGNCQNFCKIPICEHTCKYFHCWYKLCWPMWDKVTTELIAGTVQINNMLCHQDNSTLAFSLLWFCASARAVGYSIEDSCNFSSMSQQVPFNQQKQRHSEQQVTHFPPSKHALTSFRHTDFLQIPDHHLPAQQDKGCKRSQNKTDRQVEAFLFLQKNKPNVCTLPTCSNLSSFPWALCSLTSHWAEGPGPLGGKFDSPLVGN